MAGSCVADGRERVQDSKLSRDVADKFSAQEKGLKRYPRSAT